MTHLVEQLDLSLSRFDDCMHRSTQKVWMHLTVAFQALWSVAACQYSAGRKLHLQPLVLTSQPPNLGEQRVTSFLDQLPSVWNDSHLSFSFAASAARSSSQCFARIGSVTYMPSCSICLAAASMARRRSFSRTMVSRSSSSRATRMRISLASCKEASLHAYSITAMSNTFSDTERLVT